jgi:hypothetical protein
MSSKANQVYGYFEDPQGPPTYDPPHDGPCLFCGGKIDPASDVRTHSLTYQGREYAQRSYFYRTHRTCDDKEPNGMDEPVFRMIERNGD